MLHVNRQQKSFTPLASRKLAEADILERTVQRMILQSPDAFFHEMGEHLKLLGEEIRPDEFVGDRIDLLAIDTDGMAVIIELKRDSHKLHLLQAIAYAGMVAKWELNRFVTELAQASGKTHESIQAELEGFLEESDLETINQSQRVILLAEDFDYEVLVTAEWLFDQYGVDIRCYRLSLAIDGDREFMTCVRLYPPPELTDHAKRRGRGAQGKRLFPDWNAALNNIDNSAVSHFIRAELDAKRENDPAHATFRYRSNGKIRYRLRAKKEFASVVQVGRFDDDEGYWRARLGPNAEVWPTNKGKRLRFRLRREEEFKRFKEAWDNELQSKSYFLPAPEENGALAEDQEAED